MRSTAHQPKAIRATQSSAARGTRVVGLGAALAVGGALVIGAVLMRVPEVTTVVIPGVRPEAAIASSVPVADGYVEEGPQGYVWRARLSPVIPPMSGRVVEGLKGYEWQSTAAPTTDWVTVEGVQGYRFVQRSVVVALDAPPFAAFTIDPAAEWYADEGPQGYVWRPRQSP